MIKHQDMWMAIDALAQKHGLTASGLARLAGLDPTTFNRSKRDGAEAGRPRWPSTESLVRTLEAVGVSLSEFAELLEPEAKQGPAIPLLGMAQAGQDGFFDDAGFPVGAGWDEVRFPGIDSQHLYALEITGDSMEPVYRAGDRVILAPHAPVRRHDRVVVRTHEGEVMAKSVGRQSAKAIELISLNPAYPPRELPLEHVAWVARIVWASQ